jgi:Tfp pilus assembly protein PilN
MTAFVPVMWAIWGVLVLALLALKLYTDRLTRDEDDQLILDDAFDHLKTEQAEIVAKVKKVQPLRKASMWLAVAATVFVIGYYAVDVASQFK